MSAATPPRTPDALLLISTQCPHCAAVLNGMQTLIKNGQLGRLEIVNITQHPEVAQSLGVRAVPWLRLGVFELTGLRSPAELAHWVARSGTVEGMAAYFSELFETGQIAQAIALVERDTDQAQALVHLLGDPEAALQVRLGASAVLEHFQNSDTLRRQVPALTALTEHPDARIRADACHTLTLSGAPAVRSVLEARRNDSDATVREIVTDGLAALSQRNSG